MTSQRKKILLALSGGVDSAISAALLKEEGFEVIGVYFLMQQQDKKEKLRQAQRIASYFKIELLVNDLTKQFQKEVVDCFVDVYKKNKTPNPCVICNPQIKFKNLLEIAEKFSIEKIATGHYARLEKNKSKFLLKRGADLSKDQSYFLYRLQQKDLEKTIFPLGGYEKKNVQNIAEKMKIPIDHKESQDICFFLEDKKLSEFLGKKIKVSRGKIVNENGVVLGDHQGLSRYTQGQRTGLGLSGGPFYVIGKNPKQNELIVSNDRNHPNLLVGEIQIEKASWVLDEPELEKKYQFKSRYQIKPTEGIFSKKITKNKWKVILKKPQWAVSSGQSLVAYDKDQVIGGGIII